MSRAILKGNASGTGSMTLESPATNSNRTVTVPDVDGQMMVSSAMPAFSAYQSSAQTIANVTWTKVSFNAKTFDTASAFDATTNYRFQPLVAGYYQVNITTGVQSSANTALTVPAIYKNGSVYLSQYSCGTAGGNFSAASISTSIYLNGSTDYVEGYLWQSTGSSQTILNGTPTICNFSASMVRAA